MNSLIPCIGHKDRTLIPENAPKLSFSNSISLSWWIILIFISFWCNDIYAEKIINIPSVKGDATKALQEVLNSLSKFNGEKVTILLSEGQYNISRKESCSLPYHISNTVSFEEHPDPTKHIGLLFKNLRNVVFDGNGAKIVTHGEMTSIVIDSCENVVLKNFTLTSADPSVVEIKITEKDIDGFTFEITPPSEFVIDDGIFYFKGCDWIFGDGESITRLPQLAQVYYPDKNITLRTSYPLKNYKNVKQTGDHTVRMEFEEVPDVTPGEIYQLRHGIRYEAAGFINRSCDIRLQNIDFNFLGNFGIVGQFSENLTYDNISCQPDLESGRTNAGFADFIQMSGCKGRIIIKNSRFEGSHDDPINIHGTFLNVTNFNSPYQLTVRYMHPQTYGFLPFIENDEIEIINRNTLNPVDTIHRYVTKINQIDDYNYLLEIDKPLPELENYYYEDLTVENVTWTPEVEISNNYFAATPTRGVLITTRGKSLIENNTFFRIPMPSILVSDDARSWYESGAVKDLTIRNNTFIECSNPVIKISPEIETFDQPVHKNILIENNEFIGDSKNFFMIDGSDNVIIRNNTFKKN